MLELVFGRSGFGKTEYVFNSIKSLVQNNSGNIMLICPEQFSYAAERRLLSDLKEQGSALVNNTSFTRLSNDVKREYGSVNLPVLTKGAKLILMAQAVEMSKSSLLLFSKKLDSLSFVTAMVKISDEMKSCNLTSMQVKTLSSDIENETLKCKMNDISLIMSNYEKLISDRYLDSADDLTRLYNVLKDKDYFKNKNVFIDGFNGFVAQEYKLLELIIGQADKVTITLCTDSFDKNDNYNLFAYVNNSAGIIKKIADKAGVDTKILNLQNNYRAKNSTLKSLEKGLFSDNFEISSADKNELSVYFAKSISDECNEAARQIRHLLRKGYKASEIAVITRDLNKYRDELSSAFKRFDIPFFNDERQPIKNQPLVVFIEYLMRCINYSFRSEDILSLAKTGMTYIDIEKINELENYVYLWNISAGKWKKPFTNSTKGFVCEITESDRKLLDSINDTRKKLIEPLLSFQRHIKGANAQDICRYIYLALVDYKTDKQVCSYAVALCSQRKSALSKQQGEVWDLVMNILSQMPQALGDEKISLKDFARLFSMIISNEDLGTLPPGIDNVQTGQADRIRCDNPRAVFVLGANEGEFPQAVSGGGILSEADRQQLLKSDFKLYSYGEILNLQERYFAYMACCAASEKVFISYLGNAGRETSPSEIITCVKSIFNNAYEYNSSDIDDVDLIETRQNAFELMSKGFLINNRFYSSLKKFFENDSRYKSIEALSFSHQPEISDKAVAAKLFGYNMYISASRVEDYYNCAYRYFCKFGLRAHPRSKAEIDPMQRGTLIHYVLEKILSLYPAKSLSNMTDNQIICAVDSLVSEYFVSQMGNADNLSIRFKYSFKRLSKLIYGVVIHLANEFKECDFEAKAFELDIDKDGEVKPEILSLDDGGTIQIRGSIDRVDTYEKDNQRYIRVIDYKSGDKQFNLSDIMFGLNLQMFLYLFSLSQDKSAKLSGIPAGVLYMHSSRNVFSFDSKKEALCKINSQENSSFKMKGIIIDADDGEIAVAMEHNLEGKYIPVKRNSNGEITGQLASLEELGQLHKKINALVMQMGINLHSGNISRNPVMNKTHKQTCDYCDYRDVCANTKEIKNRICSDLTDSEVKNLLNKEFGSDAAVDATTE